MCGEYVKCIANGKWGVHKRLLIHTQNLVSSLFHLCHKTWVMWKCIPMTFWRGCLKWNSRQLSITSSLWYITLSILFWHPIGVSPFEVLTTNRTACPSRPAARCLSNKSTTSLDGDVEASTARITTPRLTCCSSHLFTTNWVVVNNAKDLPIRTSSLLESVSFHRRNICLERLEQFKGTLKRIEANGTMEWALRATWTKGQSGIRIYDLWLIYVCVLHYRSYIKLIWDYCALYTTPRKSVDIWNDQHVFTGRSVGFLVLYQTRIHWDKNTSRWCLSCTCKARASTLRLKEWIAYNFPEERPKCSLWGYLNIIHSCCIYSTCYMCTPSV